VLAPSPEDSEEDAPVGAVNGEFEAAPFTQLHAPLPPGGDRDAELEAEAETELEDEPDAATVVDVDEGAGEEPEDEPEAPFVDVPDCPEEAGPCAKEASAWGEVATAAEGVDAAATWFATPPPEPTMATPAAARVARVPAIDPEAFAASGTMDMIVCEIGLAAT
jgi:hypothetical protein